MSLIYIVCFHCVLVSSWHVLAAAGSGAPLWHGAHERREQGRVLRHRPPGHGVVQHQSAHQWSQPAGIPGHRFLQAVQRYVCLFSCVSVLRSQQARSPLQMFKRVDISARYWRGYFDLKSSRLYHSREHSVLWADPLKLSARSRECFLWESASTDLYQMLSFIFSGCRGKRWLLANVARYASMIWTWVTSTHKD